MILIRVVRFVLRIYFFGNSNFLIFLIRRMEDLKQNGIIRKNDAVSIQKNVRVYGVAVGLIPPPLVPAQPKTRMELVVPLTM